MLDDKQKKYLRGLAHDLKPVVHVGNSGVSPGVTAELDRNLDHHELIKVRIRVGDRESRDAALREIVDHSAADLVGRIGNIAILFRRNGDKPVIALP
ncbi:MAG: ribosome assembly RNA-binding protein YhbY [Gammaproteobacteria bacterium]